MSVAYLLKKFPRLSETFILNELLALEAQGLETRVLSRRTADDEPRHPELARLRAPVEVLPSWRSLDPWTPLFDGEASVRAALLERMAAVVDEMRAFGHPRMPSLMAEAVHLRARCAELGIDHLHVHFATDSALVAMLVQALGGPSYSVTMHAKDIYRSTVDPALLRRLVAGSRFCVTVCQANVRHLMPLLGEQTGARLRCHYNGVDLQALVPRFTGRDSEHVLAVGRLVEKKGFDVLVDAVDRLRASRPRLRVTLVGTGELADELAADVGRRGLEGVVRLVGARDQGQVRALLDQATLMALPCVVAADGNRDALPTVLLEALAAGLPAVSTPVTGIPEILDEGRAGLIVPERDPVALAEALARLLDDQVLRTTLAERGRQRAEALFDMHANAHQLFAWLGEAAAEPAPT